ncbi:hypothetical protein OHT68_46860 [Streptomyces canus]|uniref:hypothetical protein n=1 Tax=Streptomyces canus TaxID=58343 RepID=UPI002E29D4CD|nr:hypothetical protein [Streptomyces canus]
MTAAGPTGLLRRQGQAATPPAHGVLDEPEATAQVPAHAPAGRLGQPREVASGGGYLAV